MGERIKMPRADRAKQFAPFDALKGLQEAMRIKEYEHERIAKGELSEDVIKEISSVLSSIEKGDSVNVQFFRDGHIVQLTGEAEVQILDQKLNIGVFEIMFDEIKAIKKLPKE